MNRVALEKKGMIAELREELIAIETRIKRCSDGVVYYASDVQGIDKIDAEAVVQAANDLSESLSKRTAIINRIAELED